MGTGVRALRIAIVNCILMFKVFVVLCPVQGAVASFLDQLICARCMHDWPYLVKLEGLKQVPVTASTMHKRMVKALEVKLLLSVLVVCPVYARMQYDAL